MQTVQTLCSCCASSLWHVHWKKIMFQQKDSQKLYHIWLSFQKAGQLLFITVIFSWTADEEHYNAKRQTLKTVCDMYCFSPMRSKSPILLHARLSQGGNTLCVSTEHYFAVVYFRSAFPVQQTTIYIANTYASSLANNIEQFSKTLFSLS